MAYLGYSRAGGPNSFADFGTTKVVPLGTRVKAFDAANPDYGEAEFIYLQGVASTVVGSVVLIKDDFTTSLIAARDKGQVACAMAAIVASNYGWYQISGTAVAKVGTIAANAPLYIAAGNVLDDLAVAGDLVIGMRSMTADGTPSAGLARVKIPTYAYVGDFDNA